MGCTSSTGVEKPDKERRRLSVGSVDNPGGVNAGIVAEMVAEAAQEEGDRGLIAGLDERNIIELAAEGVSPGGTRLSISSNTDQGKTSFANKEIIRLGGEIDPATCGLGYTCRKGLKPESPNQDSWFVLKMDACSIYAVFDGHGRKGHDVSNFVKENLPKLMIRDERWKTKAFPALIKDSFKKMRSLLCAADRLKKISAQMSGTTATVCVHDHEDNKITVAHVADSTAVLGRVNASKEFEGIALTRDHKPNLKDEKARIEKAGGRVVFDGYANWRVYAKNARYPGLNMSRCLGDLMGHADCGISCEPEVCERQLMPEDSHLLLCSDGVWEFIKPTEAVQIAAEFPRAKSMIAAERLAKEAWDRWIREEGGSVVDDITVVLVYLADKALKPVPESHLASKAFPDP